MANILYPYNPYTSLNYGDVANAFMQTMQKGGAFTNSVDPDKVSGSAIFAMLSTFSVTVENIKSYMNQDLFYFVNGC